MKNRNLKRSTCTALLVAAALVVSGCSAQGGESDGKSEGGTLTVLTTVTQIDLDPGKGQGLAVTTLGLVTRRLTTWNVNAQDPTTVVPDMATDTGTPSEDGKTWTYTLKDGLEFEDGKPITSADIKYGLERSFAQELTGGLTYHKQLLEGGSDYAGPFTGEHLDSIETPDDKTIIFHLNAPFGDWPWIASMPAFSPVPESAENPASYGKAPVASGPYRVESNEQGSALKLVRNERWDKKTDDVRVAGPDSYVFKMGQNPDTATQALIADSGEAKTSSGQFFLGASQLALVQKDPRAKERMVTSQVGPLIYMSMNMNRELMSDIKVRQALQFAVDRRSFVIATGGPDSATPASTLIPPSLPGHEEYDLYPSGDQGDVDKATQMLSEAGVPAGTTLTLLTMNDPGRESQAQAVQQALERTGLRIEIRNEEVNTYLAEMADPDADYDLVLSYWQPDFPSAGAAIQPLFHSGEIRAFNSSNYMSPEADRMIEEALAEVDPKTAGELWAKTDRFIMEDAPVVPLAYTRQSFLHGSRVLDFVVGAFPPYPNYLIMNIEK